MLQFQNNYNKNYLIINLYLEIINLTAKVYL
jgi:hypothetical protein